MGRLFNFLENGGKFVIEYRRKMRFSIKDLVRDVEEYKILRNRYNDLLLKSKEKSNFFKFWEKKVSDKEVSIAFDDYVKCMQNLEKKYNRNYHNILRKQIVKPSAPPYDAVIM